MYTWILVFFTVLLKNRNISSKIKRSKVTDYAALSETFSFDHRHLYVESSILIRDLLFWVFVRLFGKFSGTTACHYVVNIMIIFKRT